ncbi:three-Cys-motif partner protein TcmP [Flagellimonas aequoris]|uniref:Three-Cys-motif partner protein TcmP n=1 Tax=Flagellimonas aequoris TaxID=2306997 RepID=A0A418N419_9FLAO|nr:three-Cys-motif partner protein TcmP [Allomuricauda aequoris]RIV68637.1 three-Cys-motif partner protein TcmP [Allomuricauda aequoris]TXK00336.1 three-Cys-motif partner protein TcmP [Allomuricauda aequoris]
MNEFGGNWTDAKIEILVEYAKAYLTIMNKYADRFGWNLLYFDGFAGSGSITKGNDENKKVILGAAKRILEIDEPRSFDEYYFVEKDTHNAQELKSSISSTNKKVYVVNEDCNAKIHSMGQFLKSSKGKNRKVLAYIDPCGMQLNWNSLTSLKESNVDAWILVPTGMGVNRLLKKDGKISEAWIEKLETFLGMSRTDILSNFYNQSEVITLFGEEKVTTKTEKAVEKSAEIYKNRLNELFKHVTEPYMLKNSSNSIMFHFFMVSNNRNAVKIANQIINKYNN